MTTKSKVLNDNILEINNLKKYYNLTSGILKKVTGQVRAVDDVSFNIPRGKTIGLVGESGCGKTTISKCILRAVDPTEGDIFLNNAESITHDWTQKIDISQIKLMPLTDLNKTTIFKFVEDEDDYAFMNYKNSVQGHLYGSKVYDASGFTILQGTEEIVAEPFAATVPKPLMSQFYDLIVPSIYSYNPNDGTSEEFDNSPRIMFNNGIKSATAGTFVSCTYYIPEQNGVSSGNENAFLQFTHLTTIPTTSSSTDFHFGECQLIAPIGSAVTDNLFNTYWLPYFNELYNPDTRTMSLKVNLTPADITTFNMYDTVFIKNREFRVNKIEYKPNDLSTVEFILIP